MYTFEPADWPLPHRVTPILAMVTAAVSWSKLAAMWFRLVAASAQLQGKERKWN